MDGRFTRCDFRRRGLVAVGHGLTGSQAGCIRGPGIDPRRIGVKAQTLQVPAQGLGSLTLLTRDDAHLARFSIDPVDLREPCARRRLHLVRSVRRGPAPAEGKLSGVLGGAYSPGVGDPARLIGARLVVVVHALR